MGAALEIRRANAADLPALLELVEQYWTFERIAGFGRERLAAPLARLLGEARLGGGWIALEAGRPLGYLLVVYVFSLEDAGLTAEVDELFVLPAARGSGLGARLLRLAEERAAADGCTSISLQLGRDNAAGRAFYLRHGYSERAGFELLDKPLARA